MPHVAIFDAYPHVVAGAQRSALTLAGGLRDREWTVEVVLPGDGPFADAVREQGIDCVVLELPSALRRYGRRTSQPRNAVSAMWAGPAAWHRIATHLRGRADILHVNDHRGLAIAGLGGRLAGVPVVWHIHSIIHNRPLTLFGSVVAKRVIVPSRCVLSAMSGARAVRHAVVVPNAVPSRALDAPEYRPQLPPTIVTVGRLHPDKGLDVLLRAIAILRGRHPDLRVRIFGSKQKGLEQYARDLSELRSNLELDGIVDLAGFVEQPGAALAASTVYVQPSRERTEIQPLAVLEAMAQGVPVVASRVGGLPEMIEHGVTGLLVEPDDPAALAEALDRVLRDPQLARRLGSAARETVVARYRIEHHVSSIVSVYEQLMLRRGRR